MLKCVASKRQTRLLNKLNKSSAIHPGPGGSPARVDQRRAAAACNITQWRRGPTGSGWGGMGREGKGRDLGGGSTYRLTPNSLRAERN